LSFQDASQSADQAIDRDYSVHTFRLPLDLDAKLREVAKRRFEPMSVVARRLLAAGLEAERRG
jgi:hypothetical protein